jgi:hypothetical protein
LLNGMNTSRLRSFSLFAALLGASSSAFFLHCGSDDGGSADEASEDITGVNNSLGLGLRYDEKDSRVYASLKKNLQSGEKLLMRVRPGKLSRSSQKELKCSDLTQVTPRADVPETSAKGRILYRGPVVDRKVIELMTLHDDPRWGEGTIPAELLAKASYGPHAIVEACVLDGAGAVRAKLQTHLGYAWDQATFEGDLKTKSAGLRIQSGDAGVSGEDGSTGTADGGAVDAGGGGNEAPSRLEEGTFRASQTEYAQLCVQELGEIPFFPKLADGRYETFDCRDFVASKGEGGTQQIPNLEASIIPVRRNGAEVTKCDPGSELGMEQHDYDCLQDTDEGMYLASGGVQPGPTVSTAMNNKGTHWVLLCRKISDDGNGMMKSKTFNDIAMIGHNPKTGKTCFFQNDINNGRDGAHVPHPADKTQSTHVWSADVQSYCSGSCHAADPFTHSRWIDGALRANGSPIVPKMGEHKDFPISQNDRPYYVVNMDAQGFSIPKELLSEDAAPCATCHRLSGDSMLGNFSQWSTGTGEVFMNQRSAKGKEFEHSHWMPIRLTGLTQATFDSGEWGRALKAIAACRSNPSSCEWGDIPRGDNRPRP